MIEKSLIIIKPDGVQRSLVGEIIARFEKKGLKITGLKLAVAQEDQVFTHYNKDDAWFQKKGEGVVRDREAAGLPIEKEAIEYGRDIIGGIAKYMTAGPVVMMVAEGHMATAVVTNLVGTTEPASADVGTIRGDFTIDSYALSAKDDRAVRNLIHCSEDAAEGERETAIWFKPEELMSYSIIQEKILYDVDMDGIFE
jgi:nucleoside-diphosphate kinase